MKVTFMAYARYRRATPSYHDARQIIPGDEVEMSDNAVEFFEEQEIVQMPETVKPISPVEAISPKKTQLTPEDYHAHVKKQISSESSYRPDTQNEFILDLPDVRAKVKQKFDDMHKAVVEVPKAEEVKVEPKQRKSYKGIKKCAACKKFNCVCVKE